MSVEPHKKVDIARSQLETAIRLFFYGGDHYAVLTLAGAADEILGQILKALGKEPALHSFARSYSLIIDALYGKRLEEGKLRKKMNAARNEVKHFDSFEEMTIAFDAREEAVCMISRAVENYKELHLPCSDEVERFEKYHDEHY